MMTLRLRFSSFVPLAFCLSLCAAHAEPIRTMPFTVNEPAMPEKAPLLLRAVRAMTDFGTDHGESCRARVWLRRDNGARGPLIMYRHGGKSGVVVANMGGAPQEGLAAPEEAFAELLSKELRRDRLPDFVTSLALTPKTNPSQEPVFVTLELVKGGACESVKGEDCVQGIGYLVNRIASPVWRLAEPVPVVVEDSCGAARNGNFIDAKPFYKKLRIPD